MLDPAGPAAQPALDLWWLMFWLSIPPFLLVAFLVLRALRRRDRDEEVDHGDVGGRWLVLGGVALPAVLILVVFSATVVGMRAIQWDAPEGALVIDVEAYNFGWEVTHTDSGTVLQDELRIPVGEPIAVRLTSRDVIHSFWVPELAGKLDAMPGRTTTLVLQADEAGTYAGRCAEFCGIGHARMPLVVTALEPDEYADWVEESS